MARPSNSTQTTIESVNIRPGVSVLSVLSHLNYRPWFALAEFIDNAIQSFLDNRAELARLPVREDVLCVDVETDSTDAGRITIRDNAAGIAQKDFPRAFRAAELPPDRSGLCEFGMGMKSAACWFAPRWSVRTSALGESIERSIRFDIDKIVKDSLDELSVESRPAPADQHFTEITLTELNRKPVGRTLGKIRAHLKDIYRVYVRDGTLELRLNGEPLVYEQPEILCAPHFRNPTGDAITWRKEFDFDFGEDLRAHGFAAIRRKASTSEAGFALFRRGRLIQGSADEGYRPEFIFGKPNTFPYQRVFGEIHLDGFAVSHTKDGFQWDENEQPFLELLKDELTDEAFPLLQQAREYRVERLPKDYRRGAEQASLSTSEVIRERVPAVISDLRRREDDAPTAAELPEVPTAATRVIDIEFQGQSWRVVLELSTDPSVGDWISVSDSIVRDIPRNESRRALGLRLSLVHPFMQQFCGVEREEIEPLLRVAAAIGLAEVVARDSGIRLAGTFRRSINELLRNALSEP